MKKAEAIKYFGSQVSLARALGVTRQSITHWGNEVPIGRAYQLEVITKGALKARTGETVAA